MTTQQPGVQSETTAVVADKAVENDFETTGSIEQVEAEETEKVEAPKKVQAETEGEEETDTTDQSKAKKPTSGFKKKIARLEAENAELRRINASGTKPPAETSKKPEQVADGKPKLEDYPSHEDWTEALTDWKLEAKLSEKDKAANNAKLESEFKVKLTTYDEKKAEAQKVHEDYDEVMSEFDDVPVNPAIHAALLDADNGPEVAYYLATNPEDFEKLNDPKMSIVAVNRMIAKIEAKLELAKDEKPKAAEVKKTISAAPAPVKIVEKGKSGGTFDPSTADPDDYIAWRLKQRNGKM